MEKLNLSLKQHTANQIYNSKFTKLFFFFL